MTERNAKPDLQLNPLIQLCYTPWLFENGFQRKKSFPSFAGFTNTLAEYLFNDEQGCSIYTTVEVCLFFLLVIANSRERTDLIIWNTVSHVL